MPKPSMCRTVVYKLTTDDATQINRRRTTADSIRSRIRSEKWPIGVQAHFGNTVNEGEEFPMIVVRNWSGQLISGQVLLDGNDQFWSQTVDEGTEPGTWHWPVREGS